MSTYPTASIALSAQLVELGASAPKTIRLLPSGVFRARDGRPKGLPGWRMDDKSAKAVLAAANAQQDAYLIDFDHQTLYTQQTGQKAPAAGWFSALEWKPKDGLYATDVQWTSAAEAAIAAKEYRFISPVLTFNAKTGAVTGILMAALVNHPALDGLSDLAAAHFSLNRGTHRMNPEILKALGLPDEADEAAVLSAITDLTQKASESTEALAALKTAAPDPAKFVPIDAVTALQTELAALAKQVRAEQLAKLIEPALADGRLLPALREWAEALGHENLAALETYLAAAQPIAALKSTQTGGKPPGPTTPPDDLSVATIYANRRTNNGH